MTLVAADNWREARQSRRNAAGERRRDMSCLLTPAACLKGTLILAFMAWTALRLVHGDILITIDEDHSVFRLWYLTGMAVHLISTVECGPVHVLHSPCTMARCRLVTCQVCNLARPVTLNICIESMCVLTHAADSLLFMCVLEIFIIEVFAQPSLAVLRKHSPDTSLGCRMMYMRPVVVAALALADVIKTL